MVRGMYRSRSLKRKYTRVPGGKSVLHYKRRKTSYHKCAQCGALLGGVPRGNPAQIGKFSRSERTVSRPYGGYLCSACLKRMLISKARSEMEQ